MSRRPRRDHSAAFKANVALAALKGAPWPSWPSRATSTPTRSRSGFHWTAYATPTAAPAWHPAKARPSSPVPPPRRTRTARAAAAPARPRTYRRATPAQPSAAPCRRPASTGSRACRRTACRVHDSDGADDAAAAVLLLQLDPGVLAVDQAGRVWGQEGLRVWSLNLCLGPTGGILGTTYRSP